MTPPGTITPLPDGRYEVHALTDTTIVPTLALAEVAASRVRKALGVVEPRRERPRRTVRRTAKAV